MDPLGNIEPLQDLKELLHFRLEGSSGDSGSTRGDACDPFEAEESGRGV